MKLCVCVSGPHHCVCAVLRFDSVPQPDDLQSEEQRAAKINQKDSEPLQTDCCVTRQGRQQHLTYKEHTLLNRHYRAHCVNNYPECEVIVDELMHKRHKRVPKPVNQY